MMIAVKNIHRRLGDDISESNPILDSRLPDGSRVAAVIPPCSLNGVTLTIRKFNSRHFGIDDLVEAGTLERWLANQLEDYVLARKNILIAGGTGSGKTTLLNIVGKFIPEDERILLIEDTSEIQMGQQNLVRFEARQPQNGLPAVTIRDLFKRTGTAINSSLESKRDYLSASEYILQNFEASDRIAVLVRDRRTGETIQRITTAKNAASPEFQAWLRHKNICSDVYIGMNALKRDAQSRTKEDIETIRHLYLDVDHDGPVALEAMENSGI